MKGKPEAARKHPENCNVLSLEMRAVTAHAAWSNFRRFSLLSSKQRKIVGLRRSNARFELTERGSDSTMNPLGDKTPPVSSRLVASLIRACFLLLGSLVSASVLLGGAAEAQPKVSHLSLAKVVSTPSAASDLCSRYEWACAGYKTDESHLGDLHSLAKKVNRHINQRVHSVDDIVQYRERDYWTLPSRRGGDCEDFALLKKYELMRTGISPARLLIAMVMGKRVGAHAVLILRLEHGDFVLDSLNNSIKPWFKTGYTFLRVQNPESPDTWVSVSSAG